LPEICVYSDWNFSGHLSKLIPFPGYGRAPLDPPQAAA
jgi:hypothetical protein